MLKGKKIILRSYEKEDIEKAHEYINNYELMKFLNPSFILPRSLKSEEEYINSIDKDPDKSFSFAIDTLKGKYIGGCGYFNVNRKNGTCYIGIFIGDKNYWGKGYGTDANKVLLNYLFNEFNIRKVLLNVFAYNKRAIKSYEKLGFKIEGTLVDNIYRDGKYYDEIIMALFKNDFSYQ